MIKNILKRKQCVLIYKYVIKNRNVEKNRNSLTIKSTNLIIIYKQIIVLQSSNLWTKIKKTLEILVCF